MFSLLWDLEEVKRLIDEGILQTAISIALDVVGMPQDVHQQHNLPRKLGSIRS